MITSLENKKIKEIMKLKQKKYRDKTNKFIIETSNLIKEAYDNGLLEELYVMEGYDSPVKFDYEIVTDKVMQKISSIEKPYILGVCKKNLTKGLKGTKYLLLDNIQDPGNLGTIIRTSLGFNIDTIVLSNDTVDLYNEKVIRATEGAIFKINIIREDLLKIISSLKDKNITIYGTDVINGIDLKDININDNYALIMGNEGNGVSSKIKDKVDKNINININKDLESLNVAVATGIILYQFNK